jgi:matrix metalloproteinase-14 (membrane-inserted)
MPTTWYPRLVLATLSLTIQPPAMAMPDYTMATDYLVRYGYLSQSQSVHSTSLQRMDTAIIKLQAFAGLEQTGVIDRETEKVMSMKRCGVKDIDEENRDKFGMLSKLSESSRHKRYALHGSRWKTKTLTYRISKYPSRRGLSRNIVDLTMKKAINVWADKTNLKFVKKSSGSVHLDIRFEKRSHGDEDNFDGKGGTLAHAFFPIYGGDVHFDDDEDWTVNSFRGTSLLMSASHELGHSLGLAHSNVRGSFMSSFYSGYKSDLSLNSDDVEGIQSLYGKKDTIENRNVDEDINLRSFFVPVTTLPPPTPDNVICKSNLDTKVTTNNGVTYAFLGSKYWKLYDTSVEPGYPRLISQGWTGLLWNLDAAFMMARMMMVMARMMATL